MEYYPQSIGHMTKCTHIIPYLDSMGISEERLIYRPPITTITPSMLNANGTGPQHKKVVPLDIPVISVQVEKGVFASNFHELRTNTGTDEERELVVPPWVERKPTAEELALERSYRSSEGEWENAYWKEIAGKLEELQRLKNAPVIADDKGNDLDTVTRSSPVSVKSGTSMEPGVSNSHRADSFRRIVKSDSPVRSLISSSTTGGNGLTASTTFTYSNTGGNRSHEGTKKITNSLQRSEEKGSDSTSASSRNSKYNIDKMVRMSGDRFSETDSVFTINTAFSDDEIMHMKMGRGGAGAPAPTSLFSADHVSAAADVRATGYCPSGAPTKSPGKHVKPSPRKRELQQQQRKRQQQCVDKSYEQYSRTNYVRATLPGALATSPFNNGTSPSESSATGSTTNTRCFQVDEGLNPFFWPPVTPKLEDWLLKAVLTDDNKNDIPTLQCSTKREPDTDNAAEVVRRRNDDYNESGENNCENEWFPGVCTSGAANCSSIKREYCKGHPNTIISPAITIKSTSTSTVKRNTTSTVGASKTKKNRCLSSDRKKNSHSSRKKLDRDSNKCCIMM